MSLPHECFSNIQYFLDDKSLYKCLFVNRYWCRFSVVILWREPFRYIYPHNRNGKFSRVINTLLSCLDENEISSLIPCRLNFNNQITLFEYGKFIRKIDHENYLNNIVTWFKNSIELDQDDQDCRIQKLSNVIYHMIMRQGSKLQEFSINLFEGFYYDKYIGFIDMPRFSTFTAY